MDYLTRESDGGTPRSGRLLVISSVRWGYLWQRHQALASAAAADGWTVDFLEPHPRNLRQIARFVVGRLRRTGPLSRPTAPPPGLQVLPVSAWFRPGRSDYDLVLCYVPDAWSIRRVRRAAAPVVYDAVLDWATVPASWYPPVGWRRAERRLGRLAAGVTTDSEGTRALLARRGIRAAVVHPAADDAFIDAGPSASEAGTAVYFGAVRDEVDHEALVALAGAGIRVDVIGTVERTATADALRRAGVRLHDPVPLDELVGRVAAHRLLLLPYRGARASTLMPAKFWNCLAAGRWVLIGGIDSPVDAPGLVRVGASSDDWVRIGRELADRRPPPPPDAPSWTDRWHQVIAAAVTPEGAHEPG